jgi:hypothetical protein
VPRRRLDSLEAELEHLLRFHLTNRPELLERVATNPRIELADFGVGQP